MTTEQIRLEIQLEVQKALSSLSGLENEFEQMAEAAAKAAPPTDEVKKIVDDLEKSLASTKRVAGFFGDELGGLKDQQAQLKTAITQLINQGFDPQSQQLQKLKNDYDATSKEVARLEAETDRANSTFGKLIQTIGTAATVQKLAQFAGDAHEAFAGAEAAALRLQITMEMRGIEGGYERLTQFASEMQNLTGASDDLVKQLTAELAAQGKSEEQMKLLITTAADLSAVTGKDLRDSVKQLTESLAGSVGEISNTIPELKNLTEEQLRSGAAIDLISEKYKGYAELMKGSAAVETSRMTESIGDLKEAIGEGLAPIISIGVNLITSFSSSLASSSSFMKGAMAAAVAALIGFFSVLAVKAAISAAAHWGKFAALQAVNAAMAVANPLLIAGIAAAVAATAVAVAYTAAKVREAKAISGTTDSAEQNTLAYANQADVMQAASARTDEYIESLNKLSLAELEAARTRTMAMQKLDFGEEGMAEQLANWLKAIEAEIVVRRNADAALQAERNRLAAEFKSSWADTYSRFQAQSSSDPYALVEFERDKKLAEAKASYIGTLNQETIDQINEYYNAQRRKVEDELAANEEDIINRLTGNRVRALEVEKARALASFQGSEAGRAQISAEYDRQIADLRIEENKRAAEAAFDLETQARAFSAKLTESRLDDLELERDQALTLFEGTEQQKAELAAYYSRLIADQEIDEARRAADESRKAFEKAKADVAANKDYGAFASMEMQSAVSGTEIGQLAGTAGMPAVDPVTMIIASLVEFLMSIENVSKVLNFLGTILEGFGIIGGLLLNDALEPFVDFLMENGMILGEVLAPFINLAAISMRTFGFVLSLTQIPIKLFGTAMTWLNDKVIVPLGNKIIDAINGLITIINKIPGINIALLKHLSTTTSILNSEEQIAKKTEAVSKEIERVRSIFAERRKDIEDAYRDNVSSLQKLLELGAMSELEYDKRMESLNTQKDVSMEMLTQAEEAQIGKLDAILAELRKGLNVSVAALRAAGVPGFAVGSVNIPADTSAYLHKGEMVISRPFADGIRRGEVTLGDPKSSGTIINNNVEIKVGGSVLTEQELLTFISNGLAKKKMRNDLPAGITL